MTSEWHESVTLDQLFLMDRIAPGGSARKALLQRFIMATESGSIDPRLVQFVAKRLSVALEKNDPRLVWGEPSRRGQSGADTRRKEFERHLFWAELWALRESIGMRNIGDQFRMDQEFARKLRLENESDFLLHFPSERAAKRAYDQYSTLVESYKRDQSAWQDVRALISVFLGQLVALARRKPPEGQH